MNCKEAETLLDPYFDGELDIVSTLEVETHLRDCPACSRIRDNHAALRTLLRSAPLSFSAPEDLRNRIHAALPRPERPASAGMKPAFPGWWSIRLLALAAAVLLIAVALWTLQPHFRPSPETLIAQEVLASHIRSLLPGHLTDVTSSDNHTVKPWFNGKLPFSPPVKDLAAEAFPLVGGRLDYVDNRPVAALVYRRRGHFINVFIWPSSAASGGPQEAESRQGYNVLHWTRSGMTFWVTSDLDRTELERFAALLN
jgi:anti-sigma factor RsiW